MQMKYLAFIIAVTGILVFSGCNAQEGQDWPDWRGEGRNGLWNEKNIITEFDGPEIRL